jgi:hypothetical protein
MTTPRGDNVVGELRPIDRSYKHREDMWVLIEMSVPRDGPPVENEHACGSLGDDDFRV